MDIVTRQSSSRTGACSSSRGVSRVDCLTCLFLPLLTSPPPTPLHLTVRGISLYHLKWSDLKICDTSEKTGISTWTCFFSHKKGSRRTDGGVESEGGKTGTRGTSGNWHHTHTFESKADGDQPRDVLPFLVELARERFDDPMIQAEDLCAFEGYVFPQKIYNMTRLLTSHSLAIGHKSLSNHGFRVGFIIASMIKTGSSKNANQFDNWQVVKLNCGFANSDKRAFTYIKTAYQRALVGSRIVGAGAVAYAKEAEERGETETAELIRQVHGEGVISKVMLTPKNLHGLKAEPSAPWGP